MSSPADRELLHGLIALQNHFIDQSELLAAFHIWSEDRSRPLARILRDRNSLDDELARTLDLLVARHLARFGGDPGRSLNALSPTVSAIDELAKLDDPELQSSLGYTCPAQAVPVQKEERTGSGSNDETTAPASAQSRFENIDASMTPAWNLSRSPAGARFRVLRLHAKGGLGQVSVALDRELGREVAFKEIQERYADNPDSRSRFKLEAEITGGLEHPGIVPIYSLGQDTHGRPFYAMRFIRGDNLQEAIKRFRAADADPKRDPGERTLELRKLLGRFIDVCNAVAYAHSRGVIHRDIKPGNIMLGDFGETLVVDWGLAKIVGGPELPGNEAIFRPSSASGSTETQVGSAVGTPSYMSPEQALGRLDLIGPASDVYGLGATLYVLLTGRPTYEGRAVDVVPQVSRGGFPPPRRLDPRIPAPLESICLKALKLVPSERYQSARELAEDLEHFLADEPVAAHPETTPARLARWTRRHKSATLSAAAALVVVSLVSTLALVAVEQALSAQKKATLASERDRTRAEAREAMAVGAVKKFEQAVIENPQLKNDPRLKPLRDTLLKEPLQFSKNLRQLLQADGDTRPESLALLATVCFSLGSTTAEIGRQDDAMSAFDESLSIRERLAREKPGVTPYQRDLASSYHQLGIVQSATGKIDQAAVSYARARGIRELLVQEHPDVQEYQNDLASSFVMTAILQSETGQIGLALESFDKAVRIGERLVQESPNEPAFQVNLARSYSNIALIRQEAHQLDEALKSHAQALLIRERLAKEHPTVTVYQELLAASYNNIGLAHKIKGETSLAIKSYEQAVEIHGRLISSNPSVSVYQHELAKCYNNIANILGDDGKALKACDVYRLAIALRERLANENPSVIVYQEELAKTQNNLAVTQATLGQTDLALETHARVLELRRRLVRENPTVTAFQDAVANSHYNIACALAIQASATTDAKLRTSIADQAMESLRQADAGGYTQWKEAAQDADLKSLQARADFQEFLRRKLKPKETGDK